MRWWSLALGGALTVALAGAGPAPERGHQVVAADHQLASEAGLEVLRRGGNAVDAAVAAALAAGVVQPAGSGLGGGGFAVVEGALPRLALDFREVAPAAASRDMYVQDDGSVHPTASRAGGLAVAVPQESRGLAQLLRARGRLSPSAVAAPAIRLATGGFELEHHLARALERTSYSAVRALFAPGGGAAPEGEVVRRPDLARTLRRWASTSGEDLQSGQGARAIVDAAVGQGGVLTLHDLASVAPVEREPVVASYRGWTVVTMPAPSSGGVFLAQMLHVLEGYDLAGLGRGTGDLIHLEVEAMKHAYADRAHDLGDPDFVDVPTERLIGSERVDEIRRAIWPGRTFPPTYYGEVIAPPVDAGTQHISVLDADGGAASLTTTINTSFGSGVVAGATGVILNNEMDDFSAAPGVPNAYGLVGTEANAIEAGKRPLSSMTPTVLLRPDGTVAMVVGGSGGSRIITSVLQVVIGVVDFGLTPEEAVAETRVHHQWQPDKLFVEADLSEDVRRELRARGHDVVEVVDFSAVQVIVRGEDGVVSGASDPRKGGRAAASW